MSTFTYPTVSGFHAPLLDGMASEQRSMEIHNNFLGTGNRPLNQQPLDTFSSVPFADFTQQHSVEVHHAQVRNLGQPIASPPPYFEYPLSNDPYYSTVELPALVHPLSPSMPEMSGNTAYGGVPESYDHAVNPYGAFSDTHLSQSGFVHDLRQRDISGNFTRPQQFVAVNLGTPPRIQHKVKT